MACARRSQFWTVFNILLLAGVVTGSHFRGGLISWRPVDAVNFDGRIEITHRVAWRKGTAPCDASVIASGALISGGTLSCNSGCSGTVGSMAFRCTDFSVAEDWSSGTNTYIYTLSNPTASSFEASFSSCCWVSLVGSGSWEVRVKGVLTIRADGRVNTSPVSATAPIVRLAYNAPRTITIPINDADGDTVRCRWATSSQGECAGVCNAFSYGTLDENACTLTYDGTAGVNQWFAVALQIEDFESPTSTTALSSVPLQFLINTYISSCITCPPPTFVDTLTDGACVGVKTGSMYTQRITAEVTDNSQTIQDIQTVSPRGVTKGPLTQIPNTRKWYIDITWVPLADQTGPQIFCYQAADNFYQSSDQNCITLLNGVVGPAFVPKSDEVSGVSNGFHNWSIRFDEHFTRPVTPAYIEIYEQGTNHVVDRIDASTSPDVTYPAPGQDPVLRFITPAYDAMKLYYLLLEGGVVQGIAGCGVQSEPVDNPEQIEAKLTCPKEYVYRYVDITQGRCREHIVHHPAPLPEDADPKNCGCPDGYFPDERRAQWTKWLNMDTIDAPGDLENLTGFLAMDDPPTCEHPIGIECRSSRTGRDYSMNGQAYTCSPDIGGRCIHSEQPDGALCEDYEVRFLCPCGSVPFRHIEYDEDHPCTCYQPVDCPACRGGAWGDPHYTTYDGKNYDLFDHCTHIYTKDCADETFTVYSVTSSACSNGRAPTCIDEAYVQIGQNVMIHLYHTASGATYDFTGIGDLGDVSTTVTLQNGQVTVYIRDLDVVVTYGLWVLNVQVSSDYSGKLCGLLGDCNGDVTNDFYIPNENGTLVYGTLTEAEKFYRVNFTDGGCVHMDPVDPTCTDVTVSAEVENLCGMISNPNGPFASCHISISPVPYENGCVLDACSSNNDLEQVCTNMLSYADKCKGLNLNISDIPDACVPTCPANQTFTCGPVVAPTCQELMGSTERDSCVYGCYCEEGAVLDVTGECVAPTECIECPADHVVRYGLSPQPSCRNPDPANQTRLHGCFCPEDYVLNDRTRRCVRSVECPACSGSASGDPHYITFDGYRYDLFDHCAHLFSGDCELKDFAVYSIASNRCTRGRIPTCIDEAIVEVPSKGISIHLHNGRYSWTGVGDLADANIQVVVASRITVYLVDYDVVVTYGPSYFLSVRAPLSYKGKLCGLLGDCDGDITNDFKIFNGSTTNLANFEQEYRAYNKVANCSFEAPQIALCNNDQLAAAQAFCSGLLDPVGSYSQCHEVISPRDSYDACTLDHCFVNPGESAETVCRVIQDYADECRFHNIYVGALPADCQKSCPKGQTFRCGPSIPKSCQNLEGYDDGYCIEDCFCNNGTVVDITGECVVPSECTECPEDKAIRYGTAPEPTCRNKHVPDNIVPTLGCFCPVGSLVNNITGKCIPESLCPMCTGYASGDPHYVTFDGLYYDLFDHCTHLFAGDCENNTFSVFSITSNRCTRGRAPTCIDKAYVEFKHGDTYIGIFMHWTDNYRPIYEFDGIDELPESVIISASGQIYLHLAEYGVSVWYSYGYLKVQTSNRYEGKLCGLLGNCNGDTSDDHLLQDGTVAADIATFEIAYRAPDLQYLCGDSGFIDPQDGSGSGGGGDGNDEDAEAFCFEIARENGAFAACHEYISPDFMFDNCVFDYINANEIDHDNNPETPPVVVIEPICQLFLDYADQCRQNGVGDVVVPEVCRPTCSLGQNYSCVSPNLVSTCESLERDVGMPEGIGEFQGMEVPLLLCVEGCYCNKGTIMNIDGSCVTPEECTKCRDDQVIRFGTLPEPTCHYPDPESSSPLSRGCFCTAGQVLNDRTGRCIMPEQCSPSTGSIFGDPHYLTHDGVFYDLHNDCVHLMSGDCVDNTFAVYGLTSNQCTGGRAPTCIDQALVDVWSLNLRMVINSNGFWPYRLNTTVGYDLTGVTMVTSRSYRILTIPSLDVVVTFGRWYLNVKAPLSYSGKLCGLLGNGNGISTDDWIARNGTLLTNLEEVEIEYRAYLTHPEMFRCHAFNPAPLAGVECSVEKRAAAEAFCAPLKDPQGDFANCLELLDTTYKTYGACVLDFCASNDGNLGVVCTAFKALIDDCRANNLDEVIMMPPECVPNCLWDAEFTCGPAVPQTCEDRAGQVAVPSCVHDCFCKPGFYLDVKGDCVEPAGCELATCSYEYSVDILFAVDTSESGGGGDFFLYIMDWVAHMVHRMDFSEDRVRVGVFIFGSDILEEKNILFTDFINDKDGLVKQLKSITWKSHGTEIGAAIQYLHEQLTPGSQFGARKDSTKVGVVITDGQTFEDGPMPIKTAADDATADGIILHAVGAGMTSSLDLDALRMIATSAARTYWNPNDGMNLDAILTTVSEPLICDIPEPVYCEEGLCQNGGWCNGFNKCNCTIGWSGDVCTFPECSQVCANGGACVGGVDQCVCTDNWRGSHCTEGPYITPTTPVNIIFIVDTSEDFQDSFDAVLQSIQQLVALLYPGEEGVRVGVTLLAEEGIVALPLQVRTQEELEMELEGVEFVGQQDSNPAAVLNDVREQFTPDGGVGSIDAKFDMAVLMTDGDNTNNPETEAAARALGDAGITLQIVGVGNSDDLTPENMAGLDALATAAGANSVVYTNLGEEGSAALTSSLTQAFVNTPTCPVGLAYLCAVQIRLPLSCMYGSSTVIYGWRTSRDPSQCTPGCYCQDSDYLVGQQPNAECYKTFELGKFCPGIPWWVYVVIAVCAFLAFCILVLCPIICCLLCVIRRRRNKEKYRHGGAGVLFGVPHGQPEWEDEEKLINMEQDNESGLFTGGQEELVRDEEVTSSKEDAVMGMANPMFDEQAATLEDEEADMDKEEEEGQQTEEGEGEEDVENNDEEEAEQEEQEEPPLIDLTDGGNDAGVIPPQESPAKERKLTMAERINLFRGGDANSKGDAAIQRRPPRSVEGKAKMFEAAQKQQKHPLPPVPPMDAQGGGGDFTPSAVPPPMPSAPPLEEEVTFESLDQELDNILSGFN